MVLSAANASSPQLAPRHWFEKAQLPVLCVLSETLDDMFSRSLKHRKKKLSVALKSMKNNGTWRCCLSLILPHAVLARPTAAVDSKDFMHLCTVFLWESNPRKVLIVMLCLWCTMGDEKQKGKCVFLWASSCLWSSNWEKPSVTTRGRRELFLPWQQRAFPH